MLPAKLQDHFGSSYAIQFELGEGGMSRVFVADEVALGRKVAIKVLNPTLAATVSVERFQREIMVVAGMHHPNIVTVLTAGEVDGLPYFIMPFVDGESVRARMSRGPMSLRETVGVLKDVVRALAYAHSMGVVHRDIKPDNILLTGSAATVADFGVAKAISAARNRGEISGSKQTITGVGISLGTPQYMAPEQAAADPNADHRVDLYATGIVAYEMLVGSPPFFGRTPQALLAAQLTELPAPLASRRYDVPMALADVIMKCLEKDPADRPRNAAEVLGVLDSADAIGGPIAATRQARSNRFWRKVASIGATLGLAAIVVLPWWLIQSTRGRRVAPVPVPTHVVRVLPPEVIGTDAAGPAGAMRSAIEAALVGAGYRVQAAVSGEDADSTVSVLELTFQRAGARARVNVRLSSIDPRASLWADQMDFQLDASFAAQDSVAGRVLRALAARRR